MIKIAATLILSVMCFLIAETLTLTYSSPQYWFVWGWVGSVTTGFLINWFAWMIKDE